MAISHVTAPVVKKAMWTRLTCGIDEALVQVEREQRLWQFPEEELQDTRDIIDVCQVLVRLEIDRLDTCVKTESVNRLQAISFTETGNSLASSLAFKR